MDDSISVVSGETIPLNDESFFEVDLKDNELNLSLYEFDDQNEFEDDKEDTLNVFKDFSTRKNSFMFDGLSLLTFLKKWSLDSKCYKIISNIEEQEKLQPGSMYSVFQFNGLDVNNTKRDGNMKRINKKLSHFYADIFQMNKSDDNLTQSIWYFRSLYITLHNSSDGKEKEVIAAVTFDCDHKKENVYIYWIAAAIELSEDETKNSHFKDMNGTYQRIGLCSFLIQAIIKYCAIDSKGNTTIYLQCSTNRSFAVSFYTKNGFHNKGNNMNLIPDSTKSKEMYY